MAETSGGRRHLRVEVHPDICVGTRQCGAIAPHVFRYDPADQVSHGPDGAVTEDEDIHVAVETCPVAAIRLRNAETGEPLAP